MSPRAMDHKQQVMVRQEKIMGQSIQQETFMLERIRRDFVLHAD